MEATCTEPDLWTVLPFAQATWRSTHRLRAVTSAEDVDPRVLEVLDLPTLKLAAVQDEDPDLQFIKELSRDNDVRPPWDIVREKSQQKLRYYGHNSTGSRSRKTSYIAGGKRLQPTPNGKWWPPSLSGPRFLKLATTMPWLPIKAL